jgi:hypothetical protein
MAAVGRVAEERERGKKNCKYFYCQVSWNKDAMWLWWATTRFAQTPEVLVRGTKVA